jgi:hypothetical protein
MRARYPQFRSSTNHGTRIVWHGTLQPAPRSEAYEVEISYEVPFRPVVRVLSPKLQTWGNLKKQPHTFQDGSLCVHQSHEWNGNKLVATTIVPWTSLWLFFYETWLDTGAWEGEGTHPDAPEHRSVAA